MSTNDSQVLLRWSIQTGCITIPKSANADRIQQNSAVLVNDNWQLDEVDMKQIASLNRDFRYGIGYQKGHYECANAPWDTKPGDQTQQIQKASL